MTSKTLQRAVQKEHDTKLSRSLIGQGDLGQTLHLDFVNNIAGLGSRMENGLDQALDLHNVLTVERATPKWVWQPSGPNGEMRLTEVPPDTIAREWDPVTGECLGALIEGEATNFIPRSQEIGGTSWVVYSNTQATLEQPDPFGGNTATYVEAFPGIVLKGTYTTLPSDYSSGTVTFSAYVKPDNQWSRVGFWYQDGARRAIFDINQDTKQVSRHSDSSSHFYNIGGHYIGDGWYRVYATTDSHPGVRRVIFNPIGGQGGFPAREGAAYVAGFQVEEGATPTSYIPTDGAPVTRARDFISSPYEGDFSRQNGTLVAEVYGKSAFRGGIVTGQFTGSSGSNRGSGIALDSNSDRLRVNSGFRTSSVWNIDDQQYDPVEIPGSINCAFAWSGSEGLSRHAVVGNFSERSITVDLEQQWAASLAFGDDRHMDLRGGFNLRHVYYLREFLSEAELIELTTLPEEPEE